MLEQNYEYDVINASKLFEKYLGKHVAITRKAISKRARRI